MSKKPDFKILADAHIVSGCLRGLSEGVAFWMPEDITEELVARHAALLADLHAKSERVADYLSNKAQVGSE
jgi:hypothetical protein